MNFLMDFRELTFPVVAISNSYKMKTTKEAIYFDNTIVRKYKDLLTTFNLTNQVEDLPKNLLFMTPEKLLSNLNKVKYSYFITTDFRVFKSVKKLNITIKTGTVVRETEDYLLIKGIPYYFKKTIPRPNDSYKPLFAVVNGLAFLIGWANNFEKYTDWL